MKISEYVSCPKCEFEFRTTWASDLDYLELAGYGPSTKKRCLDDEERSQLVNEWRLEWRREVSNRRKLQTCDSNKNDKQEVPEDGTGFYAKHDVIEEVAAECSRRIFGSESSDSEAETSNSNGVIEIADSDDASDTENPENVEQIINVEGAAVADDDEEEVEGPVGHEVHPQDPLIEAVPFEPELFAKFKKFPMIFGAEKLGQLVESFARDYPRVKITNEYELSYMVDSITDCKREDGRWKFRVRWDGYSAASDTWEQESTLKGYATPALSVHICNFFLNHRGLPDSQRRNAWAYFEDYVKNGLLESKSPDYLVLSRLADEELKKVNDCVLVPSLEDINRMRKRIKTLLAKKDYESLFAKCGRNIEAFVEFANARGELGCHIGKWRRKIAWKEPHADIDIENYVDCEGMPEDFSYITEYIVSDQVIVIPPSEKTCRCEERGCFGPNCCGRHYSPRDASKSYTAYKWKRRYEACEKVPLYECNSRCSCGPSCGNRLIQAGCKLSLSIFRTCNRGWGVRADNPIPKGTFIGEYVGELMTANEAWLRHTINFAYMFELKPTQDRDAENVIDAAKCGNFTRFINHSCDPNTDVSYAYIENHNPAAPRIAFFARRKINKGEELTFDYRMQTTDGSGNLTPMTCHCGATRCRQFLF